MVFKGLITAAAATALAVTPTLAAAQSATRTQVAPTVETVTGSALQSDNARSERGRGIFYNGFIIPLGVFIAIGLGVCVATGVCLNDKRRRTSP